jgi:hypothetical protein
VERIIKLLLAGALLVCLFDMPYGYYEFVRILSIIGFAILAYNEYVKKRIPLVIVYIGLIILFQPLIKIHLGRQIWNIVDIIVAVALIFTIVKPFNSDKQI